jgi:drug/metabolite transporter (DMT)-like permease
MGVHGAVAGKQVDWYIGRIVFRRYLILFGGVAACATAANLVKASHVEPVRLAAARLVVAALALLPLFVRDLRANRGRFGVRDLASSVWPGVLLAMHFMTWIVAVRMTSIANASLLVNLTPAILPFFSWALSREKVSRGELAGTLLGLSGVGLLVAADFRVRWESFVGDMICLLSMVFFSWYFALGRVNRRAPTVWLYLVPLYVVAALVCAPFALLQPQTAGLDWSREILPVLGLGLIPTILGHGALNYSVRHLRPQSASLANLSQFIFAGAMAWAFFGEVPHREFYLASVLLIAGAAVAIRAAGREK